MIHRKTKDSNIYVAESEKTKIENPEYFLQMDKLFFNDGSKGVITKASQEEIEIMMTSRIIVKKGEVEDFLKKISHIMRANCFEKE